MRDVYGLMVTRSNDGRLALIPNSHYFRATNDEIQKSYFTLYSMLPAAYTPLLLVAMVFQVFDGHADLAPQPRTRMHWPQVPPNTLAFNSSLSALYCKICRPCLLCRLLPSSSPRTRDGRGLLPGESLFTIHCPCFLLFDLEHDFASSPTQQLTCLSPFAGKPSIT